MQTLGLQSGSFDHPIAKAAVDRFITGYGGAPFVGTPEQVAERFIEIERAAISGMTLGFLDYAEELRHFADTVMPLLRQAWPARLRDASNAMGRLANAWPLFRSRGI